MITKLSQNEDFTIVTKGGGRISVPNVVAEPQFNPTSAYAKDTKVWYGSTSYICTSATTVPEEGHSNPTPEEDSAHWSALTAEEMAKKSEVDTLIPLLFAQYYPDGSVKSAAEFTPGIKYDAPDTTNRTITVQPFCITDDSDNDNSSLVGRVVIPPFVDTQGNPYISDDGTRYKVVEIEGRYGGDEDNNSLTSLVVPTTVTAVGEYAIAGCASLVSVSLPAVTSIGGFAFSYCTSLASMSLPVATSVGDRAFANCDSLATVDMPVAVDIGFYAFGGDATLASVTLPNATTVGENVFNICESLSTVVLPRATSVGDGLFSGCSALASVEIPAATSVGHQAFADCTSLSSVDFGDTPRSSVPTLGADAFDGVPTSCKFIVPDAQYSAWTAQTLPDESPNPWYDLVTKGYRFLRHSEWEYAREYEVADLRSDVVRREMDSSSNPTKSAVTIGSRSTPSAIGKDSLVQGDRNVASNFYSHAQGQVTLAIGQSSHAEGVGTQATAQGSHAEGRFTKADSEYSHAEGKFNAPHKVDTGTQAEKDAGTSLHTIGFGTSVNNRRNAVETMQDGKTFIYGLGGYDGKNPTSATDLASVVNTKASKSDLDPLLFAQYYPDGSVKSAAEFTAGIQYNAPDTTNRTITVKPFCNTGSVSDDNCLLSGRVVIPPFVDAQGNPYISDDGTRFKVVGVSGGLSVDYNRNLTAIVAPDTVTTIGDGAFEHCPSLTSVSLLAATGIGDGAFEHCPSLTSVSLLAATGIGDSAFGDCTSLTSVSFPSATTIGDNAFYGCASLTSVDFGDTPRSTVPTLGAKAFNGVPTTCTIIMPYTQYDAWKAASGWSALQQEFVRHAEKADKPVTFTTGNLAKFDADGNPTDSGVKASDKLDSTSVAPAFSTSATYSVGEHVTHEGRFYECTEAVTASGAWDSSKWTDDDLTSPDATLDVTPNGQLRLVSANGEQLWAQGYDLATESSSSLRCDRVNLFAFEATTASAFSDSATYSVGERVAYSGKVYACTTAVTAAGAWTGSANWDEDPDTQSFEMPPTANGKVGDFIVDIDNTANAVETAAMLEGLDSEFSVVVQKGETVFDLLTFAPGELSELYFTQTAFRVNDLPTWKLVKNVVEDGGAE